MKSVGTNLKGRSERCSQSPSEGCCCAAFVQRSRRDIDVLHGKVICVTAEVGCTTFRHLFAYMILEGLERDVTVLHGMMKCVNIKVGYTKFRRFFVAIIVEGSRGNVTVLNHWLSAQCRVSPCGSSAALISLLASLPRSSQPGSLARRRCAPM